MSWLSGGGSGHGHGNKGSSSGGGSGASSATGTTHFSSSKLNPPKPRKRERWLVTRKTWRYMADAGKLLIPESLRKGKDYKDYTEDDLRLLEEHYAKVCDQEKEFVIWEGPVDDPRLQLAKNRKAPSASSDQADSLGQSEESSDYRFETHSSKFRIVLPAGEKPPSGYAQDPGEWSDSSQLDSGILSPSGEFLLSPRDQSPSLDDEPARESGIGSGLDSIRLSSKCDAGIQTDPLPPAFYEIRQMDIARNSKEGSSKGHLGSGTGEKMAELTAALAKKQEQRRVSDEYDVSTMGETVMRYIKMVRRNSKSVDQKKADKFRGMNYDPTLRNIKAKGGAGAGVMVEAPKDQMVQCDESLLRWLKMCDWDVEPPGPKLNKPKRKFSLSPSESDFPASPRYSIDEPLPEPDKPDKDFLSQLYSGDTGGIDVAVIPEDYYSYLEGWYRSQVRGKVAAAKSGTIPALGSAVAAGAGQHATFPFNTLAAALQEDSGGDTSIGQQPLYIPVSTLQGLRSSLPGHLPSITTGGSCVSSSSVSHLGITRSAANLTSVPATQQTSSLSFLSSVISRGRSSAGNTSSSGQRSSHSSTGKIISKKLFRNRSKSSNRLSGTPIPSPWTIQDECTWQHITGQCVQLQRSTLLHLLEIERIFLQKQAQIILSSLELGTQIKIPKDSRERSEISKTRKRANLLKKKVLSAGNLGPKQEKDAKSKGEGAVFGVPINQCIDPTRKRSTVDTPSDEVLSPTSKSSRSDSRTSFGSIFDSVVKDKSNDRMFSSPLQSCGSLESLSLDLRRASYTGPDTRASYTGPDTTQGATNVGGVGLASYPGGGLTSYPGGDPGGGGSAGGLTSFPGDSQSGLDSLSYSSCDRLGEGGETVDRINPQPCIPPVVNTCIKYLELHGLHTVGIFRVGTSKKRVRQLREDFDSGSDVIITEDVSAHDVATILKEFFRDLPEPLIPREVYNPLLAVQKIRNRKQQIEAMKRIVQLVPQVNRDTLYVLLNFLHLVAENSEDRKGPQGEDLPGNKMDSNNLATLFAPNILHSMKNVDGTVSPESAVKAAERTETINIVRSLIDYNRELFELSGEELQQLYLKMNEDVPESLDYLLRRRAILNGDEYLDSFDYNVIYDMVEPRLLCPTDPILAETQERMRRKEEERGRTRRRGSEEGEGKAGSWFSFREKSNSTESSASDIRWFGKKREKSESTSSVRTPSSESMNTNGPPPKGAKKDKPLGQSSHGIVTGSLKINMSGVQPGPQSQSGPGHGPGHGPPHGPGPGAFLHAHGGPITQHGGPVPQQVHGPGPGGGLAGGGVTIPSVIVPGGASVGAAQHYPPQRPGVGVIHGAGGYQVSQQGVHSGSPAGVHPGSPAGVHSGSPAGVHPGSPAGVHPCSPTGVHPGSPAGVHPGSPPGIHPGSPTGVHPGSPTGVEMDPEHPEDDDKKFRLQMGKRMILRRLSQDSEGVKILSCEIHLPTMRGTNTTPTDSILYSRGPSPCDPQLSASGASTPSNPMSPLYPLSPVNLVPPPNPMSPTPTPFTSLASHGLMMSGSGPSASGAVNMNILLTPGTPLVFSPPTSPSPMSVTPTPSVRHQNMNVEVNSKLTADSGSQDVALVLKPVPNKNKPSPADSVKTLVNDSIPDIKVSTDETGISTTTRQYGLRRIRDDHMATSCLSLPSESNGSSSPRLSSISTEMRSKTDNLDRLIAEVDREMAGPRGSSVGRSGSGGSAHGSSGSSGSGREVKRYIRRRYTDSRHPTTELPDVRDELPSLSGPPIRKEKSKTNLQLHDSGELKADTGSSPNIVTDRASYKRWQKSSKNLDLEE